jgi:hypothetical protein
MSFTFAQAVTLSVAVLGAVLGIINTWQAMDRTRLKLKVTPKHAIPLGGVNPNLTFCIEVTNLSTFPVTVCDVGVFYKATDARGSITEPILSDEGAWPRRLEPRSSVTVYSQKPRSTAERKIRCAFATTQCGYTRTGTTPALKQIADSFVVEGDSKWQA